MSCVYFKKNKLKQLNSHTHLTVGIQCGVKPISTVGIPNAISIEDNIKVIIYFVTFVANSSFSVSNDTCTIFDFPVILLNAKITLPSVKSRVLGCQCELTLQPLLADLPHA